jgi:hypothetical protein
MAGKTARASNTDRKSGKAWKKHPLVFDKTKRRLVPDVPK